MEYKNISNDMWLLNTGNERVYLSVGSMYCWRLRCGHPCLSCQVLPCPHYACIIQPHCLTIWTYTQTKHNQSCVCGSQAGRTFLDLSGYFLKAFLPKTHFRYILASFFFIIKTNYWSVLLVWKSFNEIFPLNSGILWCLITPTKEYTIQLTVDI